MLEVILANVNSEPKKCLDDDNWWSSTRISITTRENMRSVHKKHWIWLKKWFAIYLLDSILKIKILCFPYVSGNQIPYDSIKLEKLFLA